MHRLFLVAWVALVGFILGPAARADISYPARPGQRDFIADGAKLINPADAAAIKATADKLLTDKNIPIIVATIDSMASYGAGGWPIERYAMNLFDEWGIGRSDYNYGILLLVSKGDRKARIELGKAFNRERDEECTRIMQGTIIPKFKAGDFSGGIRAGVEALDGMARGVAAVAPRRAAQSTAQPTAPSAAPVYQPRPSQPLYSVPSAQQGIGLGGPLLCVGIGFIAIIGLIVMAISRAARGGYSGGPGYGGMGGGWGWGGGGWGSSMPPWWWWVPGPSNWGGGGIFGSGHTHTHSSDSGGFSGGGFGGFSGGDSGGSFGGGGGGFSGGGGSTGSW